MMTMTIKFMTERIVIMSVNVMYRLLFPAADPAAYVDQWTGCFQPFVERVQRGIQWLER